MIEVLPKTEESKTGSHEICHYYCGNTYPDKNGKVIAFCGTDVTDDAEGDEYEENPCSMCIEDCNPLGECPLCGTMEC